MNPAKKKLLLYIIGGILVIGLIYFAFVQYKKYAAKKAEANEQARLIEESKIEQAKNAKDNGMTVSEAQEFAQLMDGRIISEFSINSIQPKLVEIATDFINFGPGTPSFATSSAIVDQTFKDFDFKKWLENNPHFFVENGKRRLVTIQSGDGKIDLTKSKSFIKDAFLSTLSKSVKLPNSQVKLVVLGNPITLEELSTKQIKS